MIESLSMVVDDPESNKKLLIDYLPQDKLITISIDGYDSLYSFIINDPKTMMAVGDYLYAAGENLDQWQSSFHYERIYPKTEYFMYCPSNNLTFCEDLRPDGQRQYLNPEW